MPLSATQEQTGNATVMRNIMTPPRLRIDDEPSARNRRSGQQPSLVGIADVKQLRVARTHREQIRLSHSALPGYGAQECVTTRQ
jgi:hypothetical protein